MRATIATVKRSTLLLLLLALACSSGKNANLIRPELELVEVVGPGDVGYPRGQIDIQYALRVANRSAEVIASSPTSRRSSAIRPTASIASGATAPV